MPAPLRQMCEKGGLQTTVPCTPGASQLALQRHGGQRVDVNVEGNQSTLIE